MKGLAKHGGTDSTVVNSCTTISIQLTRDETGPEIQTREGDEIGETDIREDEITDGESGRATEIYDKIKWDNDHGVQILQVRIVRA